MDQKVEALKEEPQKSLKEIQENMGQQAERDLKALKERVNSP